MQEINDHYAHPSHWSDELLDLNNPYAGESEMHSHIDGNIHQHIDTGMQPHIDTEHYHHDLPDFSSIPYPHA